MEILIGIIAFVALLYFWLLGHWFARLLMHIVLMPTVTVAALVATDPATPPAIAIIGASGLALGWLIASAPVYWPRYLHYMTH